MERKKELLFLFLIFLKMKREKRSKAAGGRSTVHHGFNVVESVVMLLGSPYQNNKRPDGYLENEKKQEVRVGNFLELLKQVDRQEGNDVVL